MGTVGLCLSPEIREASPASSWSLGRRNQGLPDSFFRSQKGFSGLGAWSHLEYSSGLCDGLRTLSGGGGLLFSPRSWVFGEPVFSSGAAFGDDSDGDGDLAQFPVPGGTKQGSRISGKWSDFGEILSKVSHVSEASLSAVLEDFSLLCSDGRVWEEI